MPTFQCLIQDQNGESQVKEPTANALELCDCAWCQVVSAVIKRDWPDNLNNVSDKESNYQTPVGWHLRLL